MCRLLGLNPAICISLGLDPGYTQDTIFELSGTACNDGSSEIEFGGCLDLSCQAVSILDAEFGCIVYYAIISQRYLFLESYRKIGNMVGLKS